jgi:hypothetical protein
VSSNGSRSQPLSRHQTTSTFNDYDDLDSTYSENNYSTLPRPAPSRLAREKNRLTLCSYLHSLLASSTIASSPVLRSFLSGPIALSPEELKDAKMREEADSAREERRMRFAQEIASRIDGLRGAVKDVKVDMMSHGTSDLKLSLIN